MECLVGIDLGSTSLKSCIYDLQGNMLAKASQPTRRYNPHPDHPEWTVWQPDQIWGGVAEATKRAVSQLSHSDQIKAVAVTGMSMDGVPVDEAGNWLYPFISWLDHRTEPQRQWWLQHIGAEKQFAMTGNPLRHFCPALRVLWMTEHEPEIMARTSKWLLIEDFVNYMLCGRLATDQTMASCTLLFDLHEMKWSQELLDLSGIPGRLWCDVYESGTILGEVTSAAGEMTGLPAGTPVVLGGQDYLCGALPVGGSRPGRILDLTGTWEVIQVALTEPQICDDAREMGMMLQPHVAPNRYAMWAGAVAADMLEWYREEFGVEAIYRAEQADVSDWDYLMQEAASAPIGCNGVMFLPHFSGASFPRFDTTSLGAFVGLSSRASRRDMLRAIVEGLDFQFLDMMTAIENCTGIGQSSVVALGGAVRNEFWMQHKADVLGRGIEVQQVEEATALGAAMLAGIGIGLYTDVEDAFGQVTKAGKVYEPNLQNTARYKNLFEIYRQLYPALKSVSYQISTVISGHRGA